MATVIQTVGNWVNRYRADHATEESPLELSERAWLRELERRNRGLEMENTFLKSGSVLREGAAVSEKYAFIAAQDAIGEHAPTVVLMCTWLAVSTSGFYDWLRRMASAAAQRRAEPKSKIATLFDLFGAVYGSRRIHAEPLRAGETVGPSWCAH